MSLSAIKSGRWASIVLGSIRGNPMLQAQTTSALLTVQGLYWIDRRCAARRHVAGEGSDAHESK